MVLSAILDSAVQFDYLESNPARGVRLPTKPPRKAPELLSKESLDKLLVRHEEPYRTMLTLTLLTGMRIGELLALRWRVIDLNAGTIEICESVYKDKFQTPKSERGVRRIPIGPEARRVLAEHCQRTFNANRDGLLFPWKNCRPYSEPYLLQEILQPAGEAAGIGKVRWHQFRHIHSSQLHNLGVPAKIVQQQLGLASIATTFNVYTHVVDDAHRKAECALERLLFPKVPKFDDSSASGGFVN